MGSRTVACTRMSIYYQTGCDPNHPKGRVSECSMMPHNVDALYSVLSKQGLE